MKNLEYYRGIFKYVPVVQEMLLLKVCAPNPEEFDFNREGWYRDYTWTEEEQEEFIELLLEYLKPMEVQLEFFQFLTRNKVELKKKISWLMFQYGWKLEVKNGEEGIKV
jgi:hypothetical protein